MTTEIPSTFSIYVPKDLSPQFFGEIVFITTVSPAQHGLDGESFVLVERPTKKLVCTRIKTKPQAIPRVGLTIDADFVAKMALDVSRAVISGMLFELYQQTQNWNLYAMPFAYEQADNGYLARMWMLGRWHDELRQIHEQSVCYPLTQLLGEVCVLTPMFR